MADQLRAAAQRLLNAVEDGGHKSDVMAAADSLRAALAQQAEPVQPAAGVDAYDMIDRFLRNNLRDDDYAEYSAALDSLYTAPQQDEPVDVGLLEYRGNSVAFIHQKMTAYRAGIDAAWDALRAKGLHPDGKTSLANMIAKYTAPSQRKPLTEEEIDELSRTMVKGDKSVNWLCRAIEQAHGIKEAK